MDDNSTPLIQPLDADTMALLLEPVHDALGALMEAIVTMTQAIHSIRDSLATGKLDVPAPVSATLPAVNQEQEDLLASLINPSTGRYTGVYQLGRRYQARMGATSIGYFDTPEQAALARHAAMEASGKLKTTPTTAKASVDRVKSERERRKTLLALEQARAASKLAELKIKEEARLREVQFREEARLAQIHERERLKDEAKLKEIREKEELRRDADLQKIQARGDLRAAQIREKEALVTQRKARLNEDDRLVMQAVTAGWFPGKKDLPVVQNGQLQPAPQATPVKTVEQIAQEMSDWGDDLE